MTLANRNLVTIDDLANSEIEAVFSLADEMAENMGKQFGVCKGKIMASLFFEPSTRTRLSFEAAMHRLGGSVITAADIGATSLSKGESIADMARVIGSYADIIVIRHPWEGAAEVVADYAGVPVINAGDGGHEHPTQTLCDLYTIKKERQTIRDLRIALWGDLKYGRTVHSLIYALARFGATILFRPGPGLELPEHVMNKLGSEYTGRLERYDKPSGKAKERLFPLDAVYITPSKPHQLANMPDVSLQVELKEGVDALYVTRLQLERLESGDEEFKKEYPVVDKKLLDEKEFEKTLVMHPLPRVNELARDIDADPRSTYFKQAGFGVPIRMALVALLLGSKQADIAEEKETFIRRKEHLPYRRAYGVKCANPKCVSVQETEAKYIKPEFKIVNRRPLTLRCLYCEHEIHPPYVASCDWHEGRLASKKYHSADSHWSTKIKPENLIIFGSASDAKAYGFKPGHYAETGGVRKK
jgi:aspartate carbamoyltransferase catalytic subunit